MDTAVLVRFSLKWPNIKVTIFPLQESIWICTFVGLITWRVLWCLSFFDRRVHRWVLILGRWTVVSRERVFSEWRMNLVDLQNSIGDFWKFDHCLQRTAIDNERGWSVEWVRLWSFTVFHCRIFLRSVRLNQFFSTYEGCIMVVWMIRCWFWFLFQ